MDVHRTLIRPVIMSHVFSDVLRVLKQLFMGCNCHAESDPRLFGQRFTGFPLRFHPEAGSGCSSPPDQSVSDPHVRHTHLHGGQVASMGSSKPAVGGALVDVDVLQINVHAHDAPERQEDSGRSRRMRRCLTKEGLSDKKS